MLEQEGPTAGFQLRKSALPKVPKLWTIESQSSPPVAWYQALQLNTIPVCVAAGATVVTDGCGRDPLRMMQYQSPETKPEQSEPSAG